MFQFEIFEFAPKMSDLYHHFYSHMENNQQLSSIENPFMVNHHIEDSVDNKFLKIKNLAYPLISKYLDYVKDDNNYIFVSESVEDSLDDIIDTKMSENVSFSKEEVVKIIYQMLISINYFEKKGVNLRFLEPMRIAINEEGMLKIRNYIVDILFTPAELKFINNFKYLAPELIFYPESLQNSKSAIWSIGIIALELLMNIRKFSFHQNLFYYFVSSIYSIIYFLNITILKFKSSNDFIKNYIEILIKYKDTSLFLKSEKNVQYDSTDPAILLEYYYNGHFTNKEDLDDDFKDFICNCMQIDPDKRKDSSYFLHHPLFNKVKKSIWEKADSEKYTLIPIEKEQLQSIFSECHHQVLKSATSADNYEIFKNILKIDLVTFLKKKGILNYKPKILDIPQYFSLYSPECDDYSIPSEDENNSNQFSLSSIKTKKQERRKSIELFYEKDLNENKFNEGCIISIGNYIVNLPTDYEKESQSIESLIKKSLCDTSETLDLQFFKSEGFSMKSDRSSSSDQSVMNLSVSGVPGNSLKGSKFLGQNFEKEIKYYFRIKNLILNILHHSNNCKREDLIVEIKKSNYSMPSNVRKFIYLIILEVDYFNDLEELEMASLYECRPYINKELPQIKKDIVRCEEYDIYFKTEEGKYNLHSLFEALLYNKEDFFYTQGMDSIASAFIKMYYSQRELAYGVFYKFIKKLLFNFYDLENKTIKSLSFHHLIIQRLIAFVDPELYMHLDSISFFEDQYAANWILTLFSRTFRFDLLFKVWDVLIVENINIIYLFIVFMLKDNRSYILSNSKETIIKDLNEFSDFVKIENFISDVIKFYKFIPQCLLPISHEFNEEVFAELKNNEFFKNRWWDFQNFFTEDYTVPIITLEDLIKIYDRVLFVDIRMQMEYENIRVKDSLHLSLTKNKYQEVCLTTLEKNNGSKIVVLIGSKSYNYKEYVDFLIARKIKYIVILQGGIDVVYMDEASLIYKK